MRTWLYRGLAVAMLGAVAGIGLIFSGGDADASHKHTFSTRLTGEAEIPNPGDPDGFGKAVITIDLNRDRLCYKLQAVRIESPWGAHIHVITNENFTGPVAIGLTPPDPTSKACIDVDGEILDSIVAHPGAYYVNVHNDDYPTGALRGNLGDPLEILD